MIGFIQSYDGSITVNGGAINPVEFDFRALKGKTRIVFTPKSTKTVEKADRGTVDVVDDRAVYRIKVRQYMTKPASPSFDFMAKWNNNKPMPMRVMVGEVVKETSGMVYMILHGDITEKITQCCMKCGKPITNPVSKFFGMGPECGGHSYVNPFDSEEELNDAVEEYRQRLRNITWEGWIIKSAIEERERI